ncbi:MAG: tetratricopeptide repeat-containing sulfotransferase family protein [Oricola sp.]
MNRYEKRKRAKLTKLTAKKSGIQIDPHLDALRKAVGFMRTRRFQEAEAACKAILSKDPDHAEANHIAGVLRLQRGDAAAAAALLEKAVRGNPENGVAQANLGAALSATGRLTEAADAFRAAIRLTPRAIEPYNNLAQLEMRRQNADEALRLYRAALAIEPRNGHLHTNLANALLALGDVETAIAHYEQALDTLSGAADVHYGLAQALRDIGEIDRALAHYEKAMALNPDHANAMLSFSMIADTASETQKARIRTAYERSLPESEQRMLLSFARGKIEDLNRDYGAAFGFYQEGNSIRERQLRYSIEQTRAEFQQIASVFTRQFFDERRDFGVSDERPVFILGMPRSGTTLVEQILASHSRVTGTGELAYFPKSVFDEMRRADPRGYPGAASALGKDDIERIAADYLENARQGIDPGFLHTDKLPGNFIFIGMIRLVFPNARIIHCTRDPRDTCISLFKTFFPSGGHHFSYNLDVLRDYHCLYLKLMEHWNSLFADSIIEVNYETLVRNPESGIRALLERTGLDFEPQCLDFHKTRRVVRTASAGQVRKPMFTSSIGTWERYKPHFPDVRACA